MATTATSNAATAAMRPDAWVRPPAAASTALRGGLASTANDPAIPAARLPAPSATRSRLKSSAFGTPSGDERTVAAVWATHTKATVERGADEAPGLGRGHRRIHDRRQPAVDRPEDGDAMRLQPGHSDHDDRPDEADEGTGDPAVEPFADDDDDQHRDGDCGRPPVDVPDLVGDLAQPADGRRATAGEAEHRGQLADEDLDGDAGKHTGDDRGGEELGDPSEPQQPDGNDQRADDQGEERDEVVVSRCPGRRHRRDTGGDDRRDRRVHAHRQMRAPPEQREQQRPGDEGVQAGDGRHARQAGGGDLLGHRDGNEREPGQEVRSEPSGLIPPQRRDDRGPFHGATSSHCSGGTGRLPSRHGSLRPSVARARRGADAPTTPA